MPLVLREMGHYDCSIGRGNVHCLEALATDGRDCVRRLDTIGLMYLAFDLGE